MLEFYFRFRFSSSHHHRHNTLRQPIKFLSKSDHPQPSYDVIAIFKMATTALHFYFWFRFSWFRWIKKVDIYLYRPNFGAISQSTAEILLLPVSENKRPPCWNYSFDFYVCITISMSSCICLSNFVQIWPSAT